VKFSLDPIVLIDKLLALLAKNKTVRQGGQITMDKQQACKHSIRHIQNILVEDYVGYNAKPFSKYIVQLAKTIHGDIIAETDCHEGIGTGTSAYLRVYVIQKLPGVTYIEMGKFSVKMNPKRASK